MTQSTVTRATDDEIMARRIATMMRLGTAVVSVLLVVGAILAYTDAGSAGTVLLAGGCGLLVVLPIIRLVMMAGLGVALVTALSCLRPLAGLSMNAWRMLLLAAAVLVLAIGTITYATAVETPGPEAPRVLALIWLAAYAMLGLGIALVWRRLNRRAHPFLPY